MGETKYQLFPDSLIIYVKNPTESRGGKALELIQRKSLQLVRGPSSSVPLA